MTYDLYYSKNLLIWIIASYNSDGIIIHSLIKKLLSPDLLKFQSYGLSQDDPWFCGGKIHMEHFILISKYKFEINNQWFVLSLIYFFLYIFITLTIFDINLSPNFKFLNMLRRTSELWKEFWMLIFLAWYLFVQNFDSIK